MRQNTLKSSGGLHWIIRCIYSPNYSPAIVNACTFFLFSIFSVLLNVGRESRFGKFYAWVRMSTLIPEKVVSQQINRKQKENAKPGRDASQSGTPDPGQRYLYYIHFARVFFSYICAI